MLYNRTNALQMKEIFTYIKRDFFTIEECGFMIDYYDEYADEMMEFEPWNMLDFWSIMTKDEIIEEFQHGRIDDIDDIDEIIESYFYRGTRYITEASGIDRYLVYYTA